jgi:phosphoribosylaminoimidazole (AIR) synthetase
VTYNGAGVDSEQQDGIMPNLTHWIERTFENRPNRVKLPLGYFASVVDVGNGLGIAPGSRFRRMASARKSWSQS